MKKNEHIKRWGEKPYYSLDYYLKKTFGEKIYKVALDGGMSCPNRDGTVSTGGCIFCSNGGSGDFAIKHDIVISASPRKGGNSDVLCDEFIKGAQQAGHKEIGRASCRERVCKQV